MGKTIRSADSHAMISPEVCAALNLTRDQILGMGLRPFFEAAMDAGYDVVVSSQRAVGREGRLIVSTSTQGDRK
jgi:hypothetical protein